VGQATSVRRLKEAICHQSGIQAGPQVPEHSVTAVLVDNLARKVMVIAQLLLQMVELVL
jgi:hypothetical protein